MKLKYFFVTNKNNPQIYLSVIETKEQAQEFISNYLYVKHIDDYKSWCYFNQKAMDNSSWQEFLQSRVDKEELNSYLIGTKSFSKSDLAAVLRMFIGCAPQGCSYETQQEYSYFGQKLIAKQKLAQNISNMAKERLEEITNNLDQAAADIDAEKVDSKEVQ